MKTRYIIRHILDITLGLVDIILGLRLLFKFLGANPSTLIVQWIYQLSSPLIYPFQNILPNHFIKGGGVIDIPTLFALLIYTIIGSMLLEKLADIDRNYIIESSFRD